METRDLVKVGLLGYIFYHLAKELNQPMPANYFQATAGPRLNPSDNPSVPDQPPSPDLSLLDLKGLFNEAIRKMPHQNKDIPAANLNVPLLPEAQETEAMAVAEALEIETWRKIIHHPSVILILGGRGKGKSALGYRMLEYFRWAHPLYVVGVPEAGRRYLPDWIGMATGLAEVPPGAIVLVDEGYLAYHSRRNMSAASLKMSQTLNLSRQRCQTIIFITQEARQLDRNVTSSADIIIFKDLSMLQLAFDRRELNQMATQAKQALSGLNGDKKPWSYVYAPENDFIGLIKNSRPTFWDEKLSCIFATAGPSLDHPPRKASLKERIERMWALKQKGLSNGQIARMLGVSKGTIKNWLDDYPYRHKP